MIIENVRRFCANSIRRLPFLPRFSKDTEGMAAVEFSFILPIMVLLWLGGAETTLMLGTDRKVINLASSVGDIASRSKQITEAQVTSLFDLAEPSLFPQEATDTEIILTAINMDDSGNATVAWSRTRNSTAYLIGAPMNAKVPAALRVPDTQIIMAEVLHPHLPRIGYRITGTVDLEKTMFFTPRVSETVELCNNAGNNCIWSADLSTKTIAETAIGTDQPTEVFADYKPALMNGRFVIVSWLSFAEAVWFRGGADSLPD